MHAKRDNLLSAFRPLKEDCRASLAITQLYFIYQQDKAIETTFSYGKLHLGHTTIILRACDTDANVYYLFSAGKKKRGKDSALKITTKGRMEEI